MNYQDYLDKTQEYGIVKEIKYPIIFLSGLPGATPNEVIIFDCEKIGRVIALDKDLVQVMLLHQDPVKIGSKATRTTKKLSIGVGNDLLGRVINPVGEDLFRQIKKFQPEQEQEIDVNAIGVPGRARITRSFYTGSAVVDTLLPLGKGQRELIVGDRKTGKTSFILTAVKTQVQAGAIVVYAAIGKRKTEIKKLKTFFENEKLSEKVVVVAASSNDSPSLIFLTPYSAVTIAEYFCQQGNDVMVVYDDLSTHAKFYREIALLGRKFPGRESYPGDMFYTHAKLLERAGNFKHPVKKEVAITALPVAETMEGDLKGYIISNLISITDGHILFSNSILNTGRKPPVDVFLSVTRVGKQTRGNLERDLATKITAFLAKYEKLENVSHFGSELSVETNNILDRGKKILSIFDQEYRASVVASVQQVFIMMIWHGMLDDQDIAQIQECRTKLTTQYQKDLKLQDIIDSIISAVSLEDGLKKMEGMDLCKQFKI